MCFSDCASVNDYTGAEQYKICPKNRDVQIIHEHCYPGDQFMQ